MKELSVAQYKAAVEQLSEKRIEILQTLYYLPNSSATAKEFAKAMGYKGFQAANRQMGGIGEDIANAVGLKHNDITQYNDPPRPAYFSVVARLNYDNKVGWTMRNNLKLALIESGYVSQGESSAKGAIRLPTELPRNADNKKLQEGGPVQVLVNRYERNVQARNECLKHHGRKCAACGFDFGKVYGAIAEGFIHVHHVVPLSQTGQKYQIDPTKDLLPLCPNCHSVVHMAEGDPLTLKQLQKLIGKRPGQ